MSRAELDFSELDRWAEVLTQAPAVTRREARAIVSEGCLNIKNEARKNAPKGPHTPYYASSINYDIEVKGDEIVGEVGPVEGRRQRGLGNILEYGTAHNPPHPHLEPALDHEEPRFIQACEDIAAKAVTGG